MRTNASWQPFQKSFEGVFRGSKQERAWVISEQTSPRFLKDFDSSLSSSELLITIIGLLCFFALPGIKCILNSKYLTSACSGAQVLRNAIGFSPRKAHVLARRLAGSKQLLSTWAQLLCARL